LLGSKARVIYPCSASYAHTGQPFVLNVVQEPPMISAGSFAPFETFCRQVYSPLRIKPSLVTPLFLSNLPTFTIEVLLELITECVLKDEGVKVLCKLIYLAVVYCKRPT
jgi:hypothetical protein